HPAVRPHRAARGGGAAGAGGCGGGGGGGGEGKGRPGGRPESAPRLPGPPRGGAGGGGAGGPGTVPRGGAAPAAGPPARHLADPLNLGSPERPEIMWQFAEATRGIAAACRELGVPVVSGNVSLYNETEGRAILPTPTVAVVGLLPDVSATCAGVFRRPGDKVA